jgi:hypothetical protein
MKNLLSKVIVLCVFISVLSCNESVDDLSVPTEFGKKENVNLVQKIFSVEDFDFLTKQKNTVISKLSTETIKDFRENLKYGEGGLLASAKYSRVEKELDKKDIEAFWSLFGYTASYVEDHKGYYCESPHSCKINVEYICMSGC